MAKESSSVSGSCWCGALDWRTCFRTRRFGLVRCLSCQTYRIDPPPIADEGEASTFYTDYYSASVESTEAPVAGRESRFWRVVAQVPELGRAGAAVLDFGCGEGQLCGELRASGWPSVTGIDVSRSRVGRARKTYPDVEFDDRGSDSLAARRGLFGLVVMDNVVEHLPKPMDLMMQLRECLVHSGRIVVITPNMKSGHFRLLGRLWTPELSAHAHIFLFTPSPLSRLIREAGFEVERVGTFHLPLRFDFALREFLRTRIVKPLIWRFGQELGGVWGRLIRSGEMVYVVGVRAR
jgi:2-polyprenyl-3-methyl-5-hydroxy-6-metoxy-1,4-benzoquinol methylase